ncbi:hypothetical protein [Rhizobium sp. C4]|uniref:hypothetical protein n=1 Tax=Rhizobium sp. C4 TaxID=1349800 RepID=UPI001E39EC5C|nr:hypothetical protein [Rhizobium sp. C4]MCD2175362.1 hypothetical protein [Rhizobium sp. C4]
MARRGALSLLVILAASSAMAKDWSEADVQAAISMVRASETTAVADCLHIAGMTAEYRAEQLDLNGDGINELKIYSTPAKVGNGATVCYGQTGQNVYLMTSDGQGGWRQEFGYDAQDLVVQQGRSDGWADLAITGPGFCFPVYRHYKGEYGVWKVCDGATQIFADGAPWITSGAVPRDAGSVAISVKSDAPTGVRFQAPEFQHNGSFVTVDHRIGEIRYTRPKKSIRGTIKSGMLLFKGKPWDQYDQNGRISGTAYMFKQGCAPAPYAVSGGFAPDWSRIVLHGAAPIRKKGSCDVEGYSTESANATLVFEALAD